MDYGLEFRKGLMRGTGFVVVLVFAGIFALFADSLHVFSSGETVSAAKLNANFNKLPPIGSIQAWHKSFSGTPALPDGWVECDGRTISDPESPYDGRVIPNLNADINGRGGRFLRGGSVSGTMQADAFQGHEHFRGNVIGYAWETLGAYGAWASPPPAPGFGITYSGRTLNIVTDGTHGAPRLGPETHPLNMSVVWIIRIK